MTDGCFDASDPDEPRFRPLAGLTDDRNHAHSDSRFTSLHRYHAYGKESGFVQLSSVRDQVARLELWTSGHKLVTDVAAGAAACIP